MWSRTDRLWFGLTLLLSAIVYLWTMWPTIAGGDSGELTAAACTLGVVHPPGYPLYTMLGYLFSLLPVGSVGWRLNLFSCVCSLGALTFLFLSLRRVTRLAWLAFSICGLMAFSPLMWRYSIAAEVFALNNLFTCALLFGLIKALQSQNTKHLFWMAFVFGLGLTNHHTLIFTGVPIGIYLLWHFRARLKFTQVLALFALSIVALLPYAYLFWSSARIPPIAWGDITTWQGFTTHFFRKEYGTFQLATEGSSKFQLLWGLFYYLINLGQTFGYLGWIPVGYGAWMVWRRTVQPTLPAGRLWLVLPCLYLLVFHWLANLPFVEGAALYRDIVSRFWLMPGFSLAILGASGVLQLQRFLSEPQQKAIRILLILAPLISIAVHYRHENHRNNTTFADFGRYLMDKLPQNALFLSLGDINTNTIRYLQNCEGHRPDLKILDRSLMSYHWFRRIAAKHYPDVVLPGAAYHPTQRGGFDFKRLFDANFKQHQIYMTAIKTKDSNEALDKAWESQYQLLPYGLVFKVLSKDQVLAIDDYIRESETYLIDPIAAFPRKPLPDSWDAVIQANYWLAHHTRAAEILRYALKTQDKKYFLIAEQLLEKLVERNATPPADYFKNLGIAHQHLGRLSEGDEKRRHETRMLEVWEVFVQKTDRRDKTYNDIRSVLKAYGR